MPWDISTSHLDIAISSPRMRGALVIVIAISIAMGHARQAHGAPGRGDCAHTGKTMSVARGTPTVDGKLDDVVWQSACFVDDFEQQTPKFGAKPLHRIVTAVAIDGDTLYVAARMWSDGPHDIDDALTQRDDTDQAERIIVSIDPSQTRRIAYSFAVTAAGVRADWIHTDDSQGTRDYTWNPVWRASTQMLPDGWSAELAMPLSQLRLPSTPRTSWGINFNWYLPRRNEDVYWRAIPLDRTAWASYFGELTDVPPIKRSLGFEVLPYIATHLTLDESPTGMLAQRTRTGLEAGLDVKFRPLPGLTVAATINPDFGQVDVDPAFVNLSAFEVRLTEKRPFFVENAPLFADDQSLFFYSRRIGGLPLLQPGYDDIALPPQVRILGALAAGGFIASHTQIAAIAAVTDSAQADAVVDGKRVTLDVAPLSAWTVARVEHQIGASVLGATATSVERAFGDSPLRDVLPTSAFVQSGDAKLRTDDGTYQLWLWGGASELFGSPRAIANVEQDSTHFFQRPDSNYFHVDSDARKLVGWHAGVDASKRAGPWQGAVFLDNESPAFDLNDVGGLQSADDIDTGIELQHLWTTPTENVYRWDVGGSAIGGWNFGGMFKPVDLHANLDVTSLAFNQLTVAADVYTPGGVDDLTRGGPTMRTSWSELATVALSSPYGRAVQYGVTLTGQLGATMQQGLIATGRYSSRITPSLRLDISPSLTWIETDRQYVDTVTDAGGGDDTFGARYLFGRLHRKEAAIELRATWSLTPDLVVTLYAQPFASVGRYSRIGELAAAGTGDVRWYDTTLHADLTRTLVDGATSFSIDEPDFTVLSLRSTAVLRWELSPGSTLFVVWQQARAGTNSLSRPLHSVAPDAFTQPGIHTLALKLSYWFG